MARLFVGLISDTHGIFDPQFKEFFKDVDVIWHAGDFGGGVEFAKSIAEFKPLLGVSGNCDGQDIRFEHPETQFICEQGVKILMTHIAGSPGHYNLRVAAMIDNYRPDVLVCGHSHILKVQRDNINNLLYINPGAAGLQGWQVMRTALRFKIENGELKDMEVFQLPRETKIY